MVKTVNVEGMAIEQNYIFCAICHSFKMTCLNKVQARVSGENEFRQHGKDG